MNKKVFITIVLAMTLASAGWAQTTTLLKGYTTYRTSLTNEDIMIGFVNEVRNYLRRYDNYGCYYNIGFKVYQNKDDQNYAWNTGTFEEKYQWGSVYEIQLYISNAWLWVNFSNTAFTINGQSARKIITTLADKVGGFEIRKHIVNVTSSMFSESEIVLKMHNKDKYSDESRMAFSNIVRIVD
jgi:hypothetical protein